ncbi:MAG: hypothetical protein KUG77_28480 [Nannocystaceae bacterium]|nr:hypothetical protein [Nannocystaceae bacterium]
MLGLTLALLLAGPSEPLQVTWVAPVNCPQDEAVRAAIAKNLGREDFGDALDTVRVHGEIVKDPQGWRLKVSVRIPDGIVDRELTAGSCDELAAAAGLIIAVALDPLRVQQVRPSPQTEPVVAGLPQAWANPPRVATSESEPEPDRPPEPERTTRALDLRLAAMLDVGSLPTLRGGALAGLGLARQWFRVDASMLYWAPRAVRPFESAPDAGVRLQQAGLGARACLKPELGNVEASSCGGLQGGVSWSRGIGLETPQTTVLPWLTATAGLEVAWVGPGQLGLFAGIDAQFHLVRPRVNIGGLGQTLKVAPVGARALVGLQVRLPGRR